MEGHFQKTVVLGAVSIAGSIAVFGAFLYWMSGVLGARVGEISAERSAVERQTQLIGSLAALKTMAPEVSKYKQAFDALLPAKDELVNFPEWLDGLSRAHQVSKTFSFRGDPIPASGSQAGSIGFALDARGAYNDLTDFLKDLEFKAPRYLVNFEDFDLKRDGSMYHISIQGRVFFR